MLYICVQSLSSSPYSYTHITSQHVQRTIGAVCKVNICSDCYVCNEDRQRAMNSVCVIQSVSLFARLWGMPQWTAVLHCQVVVYVCPSGQQCCTARASWLPRGYPMAHFNSVTYVAFPSPQPHHNPVLYEGTFVARYRWMIDYMIGNH